MRALQALLNRIIDYAGLFPPAKLDMATTVRNYAAYLESNEAWMLGRLILPVARLVEFENDAANLLPRDADDADPWQVSALLGPADSPSLKAEIAAIEAFNVRHADGGAGLAVIDAIELKAESSAVIDAAFEGLPDGCFPFFELPIDHDPRGLIAALVDNEAGAKVRTGGVTADAYPTPEQLARFISACAAANVPFKATAGLHHPLRHRSPSTNTDEFGFLNVFVAGCLAHAHELEEKDLVDLLTESSADAILIEDGAIEWRGHRLRPQNIEDVREEFAVSFGSCSFDEPIADLRALKLLHGEPAVKHGRR